MIALRGPAYAALRRKYERMGARSGMSLKRMLGAMVLASISSMCFGMNDSDRIDAVSEFLLDRAKANYVFVFGRQIARNKAVRCYFPTVYSHVEDGDLRLLLKGRGIWAASLDSDLQTLVARSAAAALGKAVDFRKTALEATDRYIEISQYLSVKYRGAEYPLHVMPFPRPEKALGELIDGFYLVNDLRDSLLKLGDKLRVTDPDCAMPGLSLEEMRLFAAELAAAAGKLDAWKRHVDAHRSELTVNRGKLESECAAKPAREICGMRERLPEAWIPSVAGTLESGSRSAADTAAMLLAYTGRLDEAKGNIGKTLVALRFIRQTGALGDDEAFETVKRHVLFFAELRDAESGEQVKQILDEYTMPPVSFGVKRHKYKEHLLVSAYLGLGYGSVTNSQAVGSDNRRGIYAPVGMELSRGLGGGGSLSLMLAPFDFGYPISLKLNGIDGGANLKDVVAPSVMLAYGVANYPLSLGVAYQKGRRDGSTNAVEARVLFFVGFDMPLLTLF